MYTDFVGLIIEQLKFCITFLVSICHMNDRRVDTDIYLEYVRENSL